MRFENVKCAGCGELFKEGDDIVVCPECGTPQHRHCYENAGGCINKDKHAQGFEWTMPQSQKNKEEDGDFLVCPKCGHKNRKDSRQCEQCGQGFVVLGNNIAQQPQAPKAPPFGTDFENPEDIPDLQEVIEARVQALAPGITEQQRSEQLCGHSIADTVSFIGNNASVYVEKFRKRERMNKRTFNWGAFFFTPIWFFWRRLYKQGIVYMAISVSITLLMNAPAQKMLSLYESIFSSGASEMTPQQASQLLSTMLPVMLLEAILFCVHLVAGLTADKAYWKYCKTSLDNIDRIKITGDNVSALQYYLSKSSTAIVITLIASAVYYFLPSLLIGLFTL